MMNFKSFVGGILLLISFMAMAEDATTPLLSKASQLFNEGRFEATIVEINRVEETLNFDNPDYEKLRGLMSYWKAICSSRLQQYSKAAENFDSALKYKFDSQDIHYEYAQVLYASEKYKEARAYFLKSYRKGFKRAVCLYYMGYISKEMKERRSAFTLLRKIQKLPEEDSKEITQPAEVMIGDIYLEQAQKTKNDHDFIERVVIPQYEKALKINEESTLAPQIKAKIHMLQRKYDLVLFQLRNGRPALYPPYFLWGSQEIGWDSNVTFSPAETTISESKRSSTYSRTDFVGRYTFYHRDYFSISPELRFNYTYYFNRVPEVYVNDNYLIAPSLRTSYEHTFRGKPASLLLDFEYGDSKRDVEAEKKLKFSSRTQSIMLGERFSIFNAGETALRLRHRMLDSYINDSDSKTTSLSLEQIVPMSVHTLLLFSNADIMRVRNDVFDTNSLSFRGDLLMASFRNWFTPLIGLGVTFTDPVNDRSNRGTEILINPSLRLSRNFGHNWRASVRYDYLKNSSKDEDDFAFKKTIVAAELGFLF